MINVYRILHNFLHRPKAVPACFHQAAEKIFERIKEREHMEEQWADIWNTRDLPEQRVDHS